jgi:hypothetical protein
MKRFIYIFLAVIVTVTACTTYDHQAILDQLRDHEERIQTLETLCNKLNSNVNAMQTVLRVLEQNDYVSDVVKVMENGVEVGYSVTFAKGGTVTIYHGSNGADGSDGKDGAAPRISIRKASDGAYYWTSDGEWLTDDDGKMIPASFPDDSDSADAEYITPRFRVVDGMWYVSIDNGNTWRHIEQSESNADFFSKIAYDGSYLYLTLPDGTAVSIPTRQFIEQMKNITSEKI